MNGATLAIAVLGGLFTVVCVLHFVLLRVMQSMARQHGRREDLLINQLCNLAGTPWQPPPVRDEPVMAPVVSNGDFVSSPEHEPDEY